jgi:hypothetical protein
MGEQEMIPKPIKRKKVKRSHKAMKAEANSLLHKIVCKGGRCQCCGATEHLQTSHILPRGQYRGWLAYEPMNCLCLCFHCHLGWWHKNPIEASRWFEIEFPNRYQWLDIKKHVIQKADLEKIIPELKEIIENGA